MILNEFRAKAKACTNMQQLDELWFRERFPASQCAEAAQVYLVRRCEIVGDGQTGERLEELPF